MELLRRGYRVYVGDTPQGEIDFVAESETGLTYYQVSATTLDEAILKRELLPMQALKDQYPKLLLTLDEVDAEADYNGVRKLNVLKWLLHMY